jgi:hypothetical protein
LAYAWLAPIWPHSRGRTDCQLLGAVKLEAPRAFHPSPNTLGHSTPRQRRDNTNTNFQRPQFQKKKNLNLGECMSILDEIAALSIRPCKARERVGRSEEDCAKPNTETCFLYVRCGGLWAQGPGLFLRPHAEASRIGVLSDKIFLGPFQLVRQVSGTPCLGSRFQLLFSPLTTNDE